VTTDLYSGPLFNVLLGSELPDVLHLIHFIVSCSCVAGFSRWWWWRWKG